MLNDAHRRQLLHIAATAIRGGLDRHGVPTLDIDALPDALQAPGASFVTLHEHQQLRGCIGSLEPHQALALDVADNAFNAAFRDSRFTPLCADEFDALELDISLLTPAEELQFDSEQDLLRQLNPGKDGLILAAPGHRGTFLPVVWESLPEPRAFLRHLKQKAGLPADYWSAQIQVQRYGTEAFGLAFKEAERPS